jgi:hypothetical protein
MKSRWLTTGAPRHALVGFVHALSDELGRLPRRNSRAAAADERRRQLERPRRAARHLSQTLRPRKGCLAHRAHEIGGEELSFCAKSYHDRRLRTRQLQRIVAIDAGVDEHLMGPGFVRV